MTRTKGKKAKACEDARAAEAASLAPRTEYFIEGQNYRVLPPLLAVLLRVSEILDGVPLALVRQGGAEFSRALGEQLPHFLAAVLSPVGARPMDVDRQALAETFLWSDGAADCADEVISAFFTERAVRALISMTRGVGMLALPISRMMTPATEQKTETPTPTAGEDCATKSSGPPSS